MDREAFNLSYAPAAIHFLFEKAVLDAPLLHRPVTDLNCNRGYQG
jgi:hypothetical protein